MHTKTDCDHTIKSQQENIENSKAGATFLYKLILIRLTVSHQNPWSLEGNRVTYWKFWKKKKKNLSPENSIPGKTFLQNRTTN